MDSDKIFITEFDTTAQYNAAKDSLAKPHVSLTKDDGKLHYMKHLYSEDYLTFVAKESGTFQLSTNSISYSLDKGNTWTTLAANTASPTVAAGSKIMWKGTLTPTSSSGIGTFSSSGRFDVEGNVMSLLYGYDFKGQISLSGKSYAFYRLFDSNTNVVNAKNLSLPATTLEQYCYNSMFWNCTSLITAPELPATTMEQYCYNYMFKGCSNLTTAPELPSTTLASYCYNGMFDSCTSLTTAPELPAITLASNCYRYMFTSCSNLNYIKAMFTSYPSASYTNSWVSGVAASGTFVKNSAAQWDVSGVNGIPSGWTVQTASN